MTPSSRTKLLAAFVAAAFLGGCYHPPGDDSMNRIMRGDTAAAFDTVSVHKMSHGLDTVIEGIEENARMIDKVDSIVSTRNKRFFR